MRYSNEKLNTETIDEGVKDSCGGSLTPFFREQ